MAVMAAGTAAHAGTAEDIAQKRAASEKVLAATPEAQQTWESLGDGALRHKPSGLVCPANSFPNIPLTKLVILASPPPEHNALCMYDSTDGIRSAQLAATKVNVGTPVEKVFDTMRETLLEQDKGLKSLGRVSNPLVSSTLAEAFAGETNGKPCITVLNVAVVKDWAVWSVGTTPSERQDAFTVQMTSAMMGAAFIIGVQGVVRTAQGIPEPRLTP